jgi:hypothetical protein
VQAAICELLAQIRGVPAPPVRMSRAQIKELQRREAERWKKP